MTDPSDDGYIDDEEDPWDRTDYLEGPLLCRMTRHQSVWWAKYTDGSTSVWVEEMPKTWAVRAFFKTADPGSSTWAALVTFDASQKEK